MSQLHLPVEEFTTPNPITAQVSTSLDELRQIMADNGIRHLPIMNGKSVIGIVSERDLKVASGLTSSEKRLVTAKDIMIEAPVTVSMNDSLGDVAFEMSKSKIGSVIVNDENDELLGIFTVTDALNALIEISRDILDQK